MAGGSMRFSLRALVEWWRGPSVTVVTVSPPCEQFAKPTPVCVQCGRTATGRCNCGRHVCGDHRYHYGMNVKAGVTPFSCSECDYERYMSSYGGM